MKNIGHNSGELTLPTIINLVKYVNKYKNSVLDFKMQLTYAKLWFLITRLTYGSSLVCGDFVLSAVGLHIHLLGRSGRMKSSGLSS